MNAKEMRIVFMGTPEFAVESLRLLVESGYNVVGVITATDKPAGRGRKLRESAVKTYARKKGLTILQPPNLKQPVFLEALRALAPDLQVVVAFRMLPQSVWGLPKFGTFNLHASLLPEYRGAAPINWAIINGEETTGITTFFIDEKIDTGEVILQKEVNIGKEETAGELHDKLMTAGAQLVVKTVDLIGSEQVPTKKQDKTRTYKPAPKLNPENCRINWSESPETIHNLIRGLSPYPGAWTILHNNDEELRLKIYKAKLVWAEHQFKSGSVTQDGDILKISVNGGFVILDEIQLAGKRKMNVKSLLNGYRIYAGSKVA